jgi:hypothetical protein
MQSYTCDEPLFGLAVPAGHWTQLVWFVAFWYVPTGHAVQNDPNVPNVPTGHAEHAVKLTSCSPAGQVMHVVDPFSGWYVLPGQVRQAAEEVAPVVFRYVPAGQDVHCVCAYKEL